MKKQLFKILSFFTYLIPTKLLIKLSGKRIIYPFYHIISDNLPTHIKHLYPVRSIKQFKKDLDFLQKYFAVGNFPPKTNKNQFILSFDDGLFEVYGIIAPILIKRNIPAIFFINSGFTDNKDLFYKYKISLIIESLNKANTFENIQKLLDCKTKKQCIKKIAKLKFNDTKLIDKIATFLNINFNSFLEKVKPYLTKEQIKDLTKQGFKIGAHSINHPLFSELKEEEQIIHVDESLMYVRDNFSQEKKLFAFPFTDDGVKNTFFNTVFKNKIADYTFGTAGIKDDIFEKNIQRIPIEKYGLSAKNHIKTEYLLYIIKKIFGKHIVKR